jgi:hypothetical protein
MHIEFCAKLNFSEGKHAIMVYAKHYIFVIMGRYSMPVSRLTACLIVKYAHGFVAGGQQRAPGIRTKFIIKFSTAVLCFKMALLVCVRSLDGVRARGKHNNMIWGLACN